MSVINLPWKVYPGWMKPEDSEIWKEQIFQRLEWEQPKVKVYGKNFLVPRKTVFLGEKDINYSYSGLIHTSKGWPEWFYPLVAKVNSASKCNFNGCLVNLYRNGNDKMGWHSDNEIEINSDKPITSLSFGSTRDFHLKHRFSNKRESISLQNGDLLIMNPSCQKEWLHSIPVRRKVVNYRINLTFRSYIN